MEQRRESFILLPNRGKDGRRYHSGIIGGLHSIVKVILERLLSSAPDLRQPVLPECPLGGSAAPVCGPGASAGPGKRSAQPGRGGPRHRDAATAGGRLVW